MVEKQRILCRFAYLDIAILKTSKTKLVLVKIEERRKNWMCFRNVCTPDEVPDDVSFKIV